MNHKIATITDLQIKNDNSRRFTCYGNVKGNVDHALDMTMDGAYMNSIKRHKKNGTAPKMLWGHNSYEPPVGKWVEFEEDSKGLLLEGEMSKTARGEEILTLLKEGSLDSFSIGYRIIKEKWDHENTCNQLIELDIKEVSIVNFACNELSTLQSIQKSLREGEVLSKADLRALLKMSNIGLSKRQVESITARYDDKDKVDFDSLAKYDIFKI